MDKLPSISRASLFLCLRLQVSRLNFKQLSERVVRVLGQNPGNFTLQGTNTYIVGKRNPYTLIDTGEGREEYVPVLESALREHTSIFDPSKPLISDIILSHWHRDHTGGITSVLDLLRRLWGEQDSDNRPFIPPRLHKFPLHETSTDERVSSIAASVPSQSFQPTDDGSTMHDLYDSQIFSNTGTEIQVLHTPGHTTDSVCVYIPDDHALYTADTVLGQGNAVFEDLAAYLTSLRKMLSFNTDYRLVYPGHGPIVQDGRALIETYIRHRMAREEEIIEVLKSTPPTPGPWSVWDIVKVIYVSFPESLWLAAAHGVVLHLRKLESEGRVKYLGGGEEEKDTRWELVK